MRCADPLRRGSVHPINVLELTNNEVVGSSDVTGPICESARDYIAKKKKGERTHAVGSINTLVEVAGYHDIIIWRQAQEAQKTNRNPKFN